MVLSLNVHLDSRRSERYPGHQSRALPQCPLTHRPPSPLPIRQVPRRLTPYSPMNSHEHSVSRAHTPVGRGRVRVIPSGRVDCDLLREHVGHIVRLDVNRARVRVRRPQNALHTATSPALLVLRVGEVARLAFTKAPRSTTHAVPSTPDPPRSVRSAGAGAGSAPPPVSAAVSGAVADCARATLRAGYRARAALGRRPVASAGLRGTGPPGLGAEVIVWARANGHGSRASGGAGIGFSAGWATADRAREGLRSRLGGSGGVASCRRLRWTGCAARPTTPGSLSGRSVTPTRYARNANLTVERSRGREQTEQPPEGAAAQTRPTHPLKRPVLVHIHDRHARAYVHEHARWLRDWVLHERDRAWLPRLRLRVGCSARHCTKGPYNSPDTAGARAGLLARADAYAKWLKSASGAGAGASLGGGGCSAPLQHS